MPSRVIREGLLDSQRYWSVTVEARQLFVHLMLLADDFGLVSLAPVFIRRRCFDDAPSQAKIDKLIEQLADADLIRIYTDGDGTAPARFGFIPRFGQRLRLMRCKHPMPPAALFDDDADAKKLFNENRHKFKNPPAARPPHAGQMPVTRRPEVESKGREKESEDAGAAGARPRPSTESVLQAQKTAQQEINAKGIDNVAADLGLYRLEGESEQSYRIRIGTKATERELERRTASA